MGSVYTVPYLVTEYPQGFEPIQNPTTAQLNSILSLYDSGLRVGTLNSLSWDVYGAFSILSASNVRCAFWRNSGVASGLFLSDSNTTLLFGRRQNGSSGVNNYAQETYSLIANNPYNIARIDSNPNNVSVYNNEDEAKEALGITDNKYPITYRDTNATHSGPAEAAVGNIVTVNYTFPDGYGIVNSSDIYVTNNGVLIPSTYTNGTLTFTMPDPS